MRFAGNWLGVCRVEYRGNGVRLWEFVGYHEKCRGLLDLVGRRWSRARPMECNGMVRSYDRLRRVTGRCDVMGAHT